MLTFAAHPVAVDRDAELECLGDEIAELSAHLDAATARLLDLIREFDARGGWSHGGGFLSCAHWVSYRCSVDLGTARERVRVARDARPGCGAGDAVSAEAPRRNRGPESSGRRSPFDGPAAG